MEVKSESFTPPGIAVATSGARIRGGGEGGGTGGEAEPPGSLGHVMAELSVR